MSELGSILDRATLTFMFAPGKKRVLPLREAAQVPFEQALAIRKFPSFTKQWNLHVRASFSKMETQIFCESLREREYVKLADFEGEVVRIAAQPFRLDWESDDGEPHNHVPDFFSRLHDGQAQVVDVTSTERLAKPKYAAQVSFTQEVCLYTGWEYVLQAEFEPAFRENLDALAAFRRRPWSYGLFAAKIVEACTERPQTFAELSALGESALVRPVIFHLLAHRTLRVDMHVPWTNATTVALADDMTRMVGSKPLSKRPLRSTSRGGRCAGR